MQSTTAQRGGIRKKMLKTTIIVALACISLNEAAITPDPQCGSTKECYPTTCPVGGCTDFHLSWEVAGEYIRFTMVSSVIPLGEVWAAVAFSKDNKMADSSVVMCRMDTNTVEIGYNAAVGYAYQSLQTSSTLKNGAMTINGSYMTCTFDRIINPTELTTQILPMDQYAVYVLHAYGLTAVGVPAYHGAFKSASSKQVVLKSSTGTSTAVSLNNTITSMFLTCLALVITGLLRK